MAGTPPGVETCPYCRKPFKRLKSHLPHCKLGGEASSAFDLRELNTKTSNSDMPKFLNNKEKKGQMTSTGTSPNKKNKKGKPDTMRNKEKIKASSVEPVDMAGSSTPGSLHALKSGADIQKQMKHAPEQRHQTEGSKHRVTEEVSTDVQPAKKVPSTTKCAKKSSSKQKSSNKTTASISILEPQIQNGKGSSDCPSQTAKLLARQKEASAEQRVPGCLNSSMGEIQPPLADRVELVIENHRARVLRNRHKSSGQNIPSSYITSSNHKTGCQSVESSSGGTKVALANWQHIIMVTEMVDREKNSDTQLSRNAWNGKKGNAVNEVKTCIPNSNHFEDNCRELSNAAAEVKSMCGENQLFVKGEADPQELLHTPESNLFLSSTEAIRERDKIHNKYLRYLEKDIVLDSETIMTINQHSQMSLNPPSFHTLETTAAGWFTSLNGGTQPGSLGLEWFPELYSNYHRLGLFSRRESQWDMKIPEAQVLILTSEAQQAPLAERCLMDVKLQDLPAWLASRDLSPQGVIGAPCRAWNRYYNKYINVKKSGVAGISMLLLGYCILSYSWHYEHIKHNRWWKYH